MKAIVKTKSVLLLGLTLMILMQGCAVYPPYGPGYGYSGYGYRPHHHGYNGWRGGGDGWGGHHGWGGGRHYH